MNESTLTQLKIIVERAVRAREPGRAYQRLALSAEEGYLLSRLDGTLRVADLLELSPLPPDATCRAVYAFLCIGLVEVEAIAAVHD